MWSVFERLIEEEVAECQRHTELFRSDKPVTWLLGNWLRSEGYGVAQYVLQPCVSIRWRAGAQR